MKVLNYFCRGESPYPDKEKNIPLFIERSASCVPL